MAAVEAIEMRLHPIGQKISFPHLIGLVDIAVNPKYFT